MDRDLLQTLNELGTPPVLVLGDLILDRYTWGEAERVSPEAPVLVLRADRHESRPGGAAAVACLLQALGADVTLAGGIGPDAPAAVLRRLLVDAGVKHRLVVGGPDRPTTLKDRYLGRVAGRDAQPLLRVDHEVRQPLPHDLEKRLGAAVLAELPKHRALLVSDYAKGACTPRLLDWLASGAKGHGVPLVIDPARLPDYARYRGAGVLVPNRAEAALATGHAIEVAEDALDAGEALCQQCALGAALVKLDRDGMALARPGQPGRVFPTRPHQVRDVTGAGDMVLAVVGLCLAAGRPLEEAAQLANVAAGLEVGRVGVAPVRRAELRAELLRRGRDGPGKLVTVDDMAALADAYSRDGQALVLANGCFDLLHAGHVAHLQAAAGLADALVVAVNSDRTVRRLKGAGRPVLPEAERAALVAALGCVDHVLVFDDETPHELLRRIRPDVLVKGGDYTPAQVVGREVVEGYGGKVRVTGKLEGVSTTRILATLRGVPAAGAG
ncbi:MAG TPA: bifunctional heptose 7-phosphate kinase/heptose 1-phosphate adenyltransferase [Gemmataceae bacterium]|jgi:D-beta-D-heptose 7-phosphate kinase/D-beta-D-heptose 1-phosphate adenosyltransferase|nr:bifunctional heptose 7-phosphate kinase/heptose 1-phosphate adenyltransferase [Gemmataceae bacterium]